VNASTAITDTISTVKATCSIASFATSLEPSVSAHLEARYRRYWE
jgi:hypothetical protein